MSDPVFTDEEVESLNAFQQSGAFHPYTCGTPEKHYESSQTYDLVATNNGWVCLQCDYTQKWAHPSMKLFGREGGLQNP